MPVDQLIYDSLLFLQHRERGAAGIATASGSTLHMHKASNMVHDMFYMRNMRGLPGASDIGQVRYPIAGPSGEEEAQPFYVSVPFSIVLTHNSSLTNSDQLREEVFQRDHRRIDTQSDSGVLLNVPAGKLQRASSDIPLNHNSIFTTVEGLRRRVRGSYAIAAEISDYDVLAVCDPFSIRPLALSSQETPDDGIEYMVVSELMALEGIGFKFERDMAPDEAIFIGFGGSLHTRRCATSSVLSPCILKYVYLARPDPRIDGVPVYGVRLRMDGYLAEKIKREVTGRIDVVIPVPDSSRPVAMQIAGRLSVPCREGFFRNRYVGRTFITSGQAVHKKSAYQKFSTMAIEFKDKSVLTVDDSIVRGTTSSEIVQVARDAGAKKVISAPITPPVKFPDVCSVDMPTHGELVAYGRTHEETVKVIGVGQLVYQDVESMKRVVYDINPTLKDFDTSCFDGKYVTDDIDEAYLDRLETACSNSAKADRENAQNDGLHTQLHLQRSVVNE